MTQPDKLVPPTLGALTHPGLAQWAAMSQEDWEELMRDSIRSHIDPLEQFINALKNGLDELGDLIVGIVTVVTGGHGTAVAADAVAAFQTLVGWVIDVKDVLRQLLDGIAGVTGAAVGDAVKIIVDLSKAFWDFIHGIAGGQGTVASAVAFITAINQGLKDLTDGIWQAFTGLAGTGKTVTEAVAAITSWLSNTFNDLKTKFQQLLDGLAGGTVGATVTAAINGFNTIKTNLQNLIDGIWKAFTGGVGTGKTVTEAVNAITSWLTNTFNAVKNNLQSLIDGLAGTTAATVAAAVAAVSKIRTDLQSFVDGIWQKFTGQAGTGKTVAQAVQAVADWLSNQFQKLIDGIVGVVSGGTVTGKLVQDAINAINTILGVGQTAQGAADNANIGVEAIKASLAGGKSDEFNYTVANELPATYYAVSYSGTGNSSWGPDGSGALVWKTTLTPIREVTYRRSDAAMPGDVATVTLVLSAAPYNNTQAALYAYANMGASDKACRRVKIGGNGITAEVLNAAGTASSITGGNQYGGTSKAGDVVECRFGLNSIEVYRNGVLLFTVNSGPIDASHRFVGIGAYMPTFVGLVHPGGELAGWTWVPSAGGATLLSTQQKTNPQGKPQQKGSTP